MDETTDMATTFGSPASRADQMLAWNMQLIGHHELAGFGGVGEGMAIQKPRMVDASSG